MDMWPYPPLDSLDPVLDELELWLDSPASVLRDERLSIPCVLEDDFDDFVDGDEPLEDDDDDDLEDEDDLDETLLNDDRDDDCELRDDDLEEDDWLDWLDRETCVDEPDEELREEKDLVTDEEEDSDDADDNELLEDDVLLENDDLLERLERLLSLMLLVLLFVMSCWPLLSPEAGHPVSPDTCRPFPRRHHRPSPAATSRSRSRGG
jgi:hypothetical protein